MVMDVDETRRDGQPLGLHDRGGPRPPDPADLADGAAR